MQKKERRSPMDQEGSKRKVPFKRNLLQEIRATLDADDSKSGEAVKRGAAPSNFELMAAMIRQISVLENTVRSQAQEMDQKDKLISVLEERLRSQEDSDLESAPGAGSRDGLKKRCQLLHNKVQEMEAPYQHRLPHSSEEEEKDFLSDYGLIWVGDGDSSDSEESRPTTSSGVPADRGFQMNFDLVLQRIRELNVLAGEGESFVQPTGTGAKLAKKDPVQLKLYRNGIVMFDGPFRSYREYSTQRCMQDLMDGYFPSELQHRFPDGVPFEVQDRRGEEYFFQLPWDTFPGDGQALHGKKSTNSVGWMPGKSTEQFLSKLPKMVVKAGKVIPIRASLRRTLQGSPGAQSGDSQILIDTPALQAVMDRTQRINSEKATQGVVTLKLKSEDGNRTYRMKMSLSETVGQLRGYLDKHRGAGQPGYDIISPYPRCSFGDDGRTLQSCGLSANTTLLLRSRQQRHQ